MSKDLTRRWYIYWTDENFRDPEYAIVAAIHEIKKEGYEPLKIYADSITRGQLLDKLVASTARLAEPWMNVQSFYGLPVVRSKQLYITFK